MLVSEPALLVESKGLSYSLHLGTRPTMMCVDSEQYQHCPLQDVLLVYTEPHPLTIASIFKAYKPMYSSPVVSELVSHVT